MKQLLKISLHGYLFRKTTRTLSHDRNHCWRFFSPFNRVHEIPQYVFKGQILDSKKQTEMKSMKWMSFVRPRTNPDLMNMEVWTYPKPFMFVSDMLYFFFVVSTVDVTFSLSEFIRSSRQALQVVTTLMSTLKFDELELLLTPECKKAVEKNLTEKWTEKQARILAVDPQYIISTRPCDVRIVSDTVNENRIFLEVRVIHHTWLQYCDDFIRLSDNVFLKSIQKDFINSCDGKVLMHAVYNSRFIKEITEGRSGHWIISHINVQIYPMSLRAV